MEENSLKHIDVITIIADLFVSLFGLTLLLLLASRIERK
jgi:hypothetical protein